jgi:EEF1A lysine methyltransferase 2
MHKFLCSTILINAGDFSFKYTLIIISLIVGTGNAMMLIEMSEEGYTNLTGIDYSQKSIEFARKITSDRGLSNIHLKVIDLLDLNCTNELEIYDIVHDKGTFDAIGLMEKSEEKKQVYVRNVVRLLKDDGFFLITSCNFTENELINQFNQHFIKYETIPTQNFQFGGKVGKNVTAMCFKKSVNT